MNGASTISPSTANGGAAASILAGAILTSSDPASILASMDVANAAAAYAHLNGVIDPSVVAMMPDLKKIKIDHEHGK